MTVMRATALAVVCGVRSALSLCVRYTNVFTYKNYAAHLTIDGNFELWLPNVLARLTRARKVYWWFDPETSG